MKKMKAKGNYKRSALHSPLSSNVQRSSSKLPKRDGFEEILSKHILSIENEDVNKTPDQITSLYLNNNLHPYTVPKTRKFYELILKEIESFKITHNMRSIRERAFFNFKSEKSYYKGKLVYKSLYKRKIQRS